MPFCHDPAITYLKQFGYSVVRLPRADLRPLQLFAGDGTDLAPLGELTTVMRPHAGVQLPPIAPDQPGPSITGENASTLKVGIGLSVLGSVLGAMGAGKIALDGAYTSAATVTFEFLNTVTNSVEIAAIDKFLGGSDVDPNAVGTMKLLSANDVYVVNAVIRSAEITVTAKTKSGTEAKVELPEIEKVLKGKVDLSVETTSNSKITYRGKTLLTFGFQAIRLYWDQGGYSAFEPLAAGQVAARALDKADYEAAHLPPLPTGVNPLDRPQPLLHFAD